MQEKPNKTEAGSGGDSSKFVLDIFQVSSKRQVFVQVADFLAPYLPHIDRDVIVKNLSSREQLGSTAIGNGIAIPHAQISGLENSVGLLLRSRQEINFDAADGMPVDIFYVLLVPQGSGASHLPLISRVARVFRKDDFRQKIRGAALKDIYDILAANGLKDIGFLSKALTQAASEKEKTLG